MGTKMYSRKGYAYWYERKLREFVIAPENESALDLAQISKSYTTNTKADTEDLIDFIAAMNPPEFTLPDRTPQKDYTGKYDLNLLLDDAANQIVLLEKQKSELMSTINGKEARIRELCKDNEMLAKELKKVREEVADIMEPRRFLEYAVVCGATIAFGYAVLSTCGIL